MTGKPVAIRISAKQRLTHRFHGPGHCADIARTTSFYEDDAQAMKKRRCVLGLLHLK
jgi:hypothetical protein